MLNGHTIKLKDEEKTDDYYYRDVYINPLDISIAKQNYSGKGGASYSMAQYDTKYYDNKFYGGGEENENPGIINRITNSLFNHKSSATTGGTGGNDSDDEADSDSDNGDDSYEGDGAYNKHHRDRYKKILTVLENNAACIEYLDSEEKD